MNNVDFIFSIHLISIYMLYDTCPNSPIVVFDIFKNFIAYVLCFALLQCKVYALSLFSFMTLLSRKFQAEVPTCSDF